MSRRSRVAVEQRKEKLEMKTVNAETDLDHNVDQFNAHIRN